MQLFEMIFGQRDFPPRLENHVHRRRIASDFFLVARFELVLFEVGKQLFDFAVGQFDAFDAG